ncbi:hypothetical protein IscW_ISCW019450, partial [Ixodes scapularis]
PQSRNPNKVRNHGQFERAQTAGPSPTVRSPETRSHGVLRGRLRRRGNAEGSLGAPASIDALRRLCLRRPGDTRTLDSVALGPRAEQASRGCSSPESAAQSAEIVAVLTDGPPRALARCPEALSQ